MHVKQLDTIEVKSAVGNLPNLPNRVNVQLDGIRTQLDVIWDSDALKENNKPGTYDKEGRMKTKKYPNQLIEKRPDPNIYKHTDGYYYFTGSYPEYDRIILRRAKTIKGLKEAEEFVIWHKHDQGIMSSHIWAPEIHFIDGKWYIHFAAGADDV